MKKRLYTSIALLLLALNVMALARLFPSFADFWLKNVIAPVNGFMGSIVGMAPIALVELFAGAVLLLVLWIVFFGRAKGISILLSLVFCIYTVLWVPVYFAESAHPYASGKSVTEEQLVKLSAELIAELSSQPVPEVPENAREIAREAMAKLDLPVKANASYKVARYPEWMQKMRLAGIYVPWTFEAVVNFSGVNALFTACHELAHLGGIADEGQANIAAYLACQEAGGAFAYAAKLWALRYALPMLRETDMETYRETVYTIPDNLMALLRSIGAFSSATKSDFAHQAFLSMNGIAHASENYDELIGWLCME